MSRCQALRNIELLDNGGDFYMATPRPSQWSVLTEVDWVEDRSVTHVWMGGDDAIRPATYSDESC